MPRSSSTLPQQVKGSIAGNDGIRIMRCGHQSRAVFTVRKGIVSVKIGTAISWVGNLAVLIVINKGAGDDFYNDDTEAPPPPPVATASSSSSSPSASGPGALPVRSSCIGEILAQELTPPYLVPRPAMFPEPTLKVEVMWARNLVSPFKYVERQGKKSRRKEMYGHAEVLTCLAFVPPVLHG